MGSPTNGNDPQPSIFLSWNETVRTQGHVVGTIGTSAAEEALLPWRALLRFSRCRITVVWRCFSPTTYHGVCFFLFARSRFVDTLAIGVAVSTIRTRGKQPCPWRLRGRKVVDDEPRHLVDQQRENRTTICCVLAANQNQAISFKGQGYAFHTSRPTEKKCQGTMETFNRALHIRSFLRCKTQCTNSHCQHGTFRRTHLAHAKTK